MTATANEGPSIPTPVRERGYANESAGASYFWAQLARERTPELRWPYSIDVFEDMTTEAQVASVLSAVITPILRTPWRIDGNGCRDEVNIHVSDSLGLPLVGEGNEVPANRTRDRFSWTEHLAVALEDPLVFGHAVFEQVYRPTPSGLLALRKLGYRPPRSIAKFNIARDGGLLSVEQKAPLGGPGSGVTLPVSRLVVYTHKRKGANWVGRSLLRPAYPYWLLKEQMLRVDAQTHARNGMGIPKYTGAPGEADLTAGEEIATDMRAGDNSGVAIPNGAELELMGVTGSTTNPLESVKYYDEQIARAVLAHFLNLGSQTGSWALGSTFADFFTLSIQSIAEQIRDTATKHVVEDLVDVNWGPDEPAPRLVFDEIGSRADSIVQAIATLVGAEVLKPDEDLEQFVRTALGLPARSSVPFPTQTS